MSAEEPPLKRRKMDAEEEEEEKEAEAPAMSTISRTKPGFTTLRNKYASCWLNAALGLMGEIYPQLSPEAKDDSEDRAELMRYLKRMEESDLDKIPFDDDLGAIYAKYANTPKRQQDSAEAVQRILDILDPGMQVVGVDESITLTDTGKRVQGMECAVHGQRTVFTNTKYFTETLFRSMGPALHLNYVAVGKNDRGKMAIGITPEAGELFWDLKAADHVLHGPISKVSRASANGFPMDNHNIRSLAPTSTTCRVGPVVVDSFQEIPISSDTVALGVDAKDDPRLQIASRVFTKTTMYDSATDYFMVCLRSVARDVPESVVLHDGVKMELVASVNHSTGKRRGGHFICMRKDAEGTWWIVNDTQPKCIEAKSFAVNVPVILLYKRV